MLPNKGKCEVSDVSAERYVTMEYEIVECRRRHQQSEMFARLLAAKAGVRGE